MTIELKRNNVPTKEGYYFVLGKQYDRPDFVRVVMFDGREIWNTAQEYGNRVGLGCGTTLLSDYPLKEAQWSEEIIFRAELNV